MFLKFLGSRNQKLMLELYCLVFIAYVNCTVNHTMSWDSSLTFHLSSPVSELKSPSSQIWYGSHLNLTQPSQLQSWWAGWKTKEEILIPLSHVFLWVYHTWSSTTFVETESLFPLCNINTTSSDGHNWTNIDLSIQVRQQAQPILLLCWQLLSWLKTFLWLLFPPPKSPP